MQTLVFLFSLMLLSWLSPAGAADLAQDIQKEVKGLQTNLRILGDFYMCPTPSLHRADIVDLRNALQNNEDGLNDLENASVKLIDRAIESDKKKLRDILKLAEVAISKEAYGRLIQDAEAKLNLALLNRERIKHEIQRVRDYNDEVTREEFENKSVLLLPTRTPKLIELREDFCSKISSLRTVGSMLLDLYTSRPNYDFDKISFTLQGALNGSVVHEVNIPVYEEDNSLIKEELFAIRFDLEMIKIILGDDKESAVRFVARRSYLDRLPIINLLPLSGLRPGGYRKILMEYTVSKGKITYPSRLKIENVVFVVLGIKNENLRLYKNNK